MTTPEPLSYDVAIPQLSKEKNLWHVVRAELAIPSKHWIYRLWVIEATSAVVAALVGATSPDGPRAVAKLVGAAFGVGFAFATGILGFLVAGFTIFATLTNSDLVVAMARHPKYATSQLSTFKHNMIIFMRVFVHYLIFEAMYVAYQVVAWPSGWLAWQVAHLSTGAFLFVASAGFALAVGLLAHLFVELQSFIFNIYASVMTMARWKVQEAEKAEAQAAREAGLAGRDVRVAPAPTVAPPAPAPRAPVSQMVLVDELAEAEVQAAEGEAIAVRRLKTST